MENNGGECSWPVSERRGKGKKFWVKWRDVELGPWDWVSKKTGDTNDWRSWMKIAKKGGKLYLLIDGAAYGPFDRFGRKRWFTGTHNAFACTVIRGRGIFLIEGGRMEKKGELVEKGGGTILKIGGRGFGPYRKVTELMFGAGGRHWSADIEKPGRWHGFVVDGVEYGPFPRQFFGARFSPDGNRWFVTLDRGRHNVVCRFILDGKAHGPLRIGEMSFLGDNRFCYTHTKSGKHFFVLEEREIGPFEYDGMDFDLLGEDVWAVKGFIGKGSETRRRCVIYVWFAQENRRVFFTANGGETLEDAIEIINAEDSDQGVAAEHLYLGALFGVRKMEHELTGQRLIQRNGRHYDQLVWKTADGKEGSIFFDITGFFGRFAREIEEILGENEKCVKG